MTTTSDLTAQRSARARAFVKQELKKGRAWSSLTYEYDRDTGEQAHEGPQDARTATEHTARED